MNNKVVEALEVSAAVIKTMAESIHDLQKMCLDLNEKQVAIIATLALKGITINSQEVKEMLNDASRDPSAH